MQGSDIQKIGWESQRVAESLAEVLVIDDDPDINTCLAMILNAAGYVTHCCRSGLEAVESVRRQMPGLVIADINLAGHSGLELCERMRRDEGLSGVPWMFLSGAQLPDIIRRAHQAGGSYYLRKPFDPEVLLQLVERLLPPPPADVPDSA